MDYRRITQIVFSACFATTLASTPLAAAESPAKGKTIQVAVAANSPPMTFKSNDGKIQGAEVDIFNGYCQSRGCTVSIKQYTFDGMLSAVASGQDDVAFSAISITPKRQQVMDFSTPYYDNTWYLISLSNRDIDIADLQNLKKYKIGYPRGYAYSDLIRSDLEPKGYYSLKDVKLYPSYAEVIAELQNQKIDLAFIEKPVLKDYQNKRHTPITERRVFTEKDSLGFAFKKGSPLRADFDAYLAEMGRKQIDQIVDKWMD